jgi:cytoskeletal protein RodZ
VSPKKRKKRHWLRSLVLLVITPLTIWALAFLIWFYWYNLFGRGVDTLPAKAGKEVEGSRKSSDKSSQERIGEEDRRKLEEILKNKR